MLEWKVSETLLESSSSKTYQQPKQKLHRGFLKFVVAFSVIINVCLLILFMVLFAFKSFKSVPSHEDINQKHPVCFDCNYLGSEVETSDTLYEIYRTSNNTFCCLKETGELSHVFEKIILTEVNKLYIEGSQRQTEGAPSTPPSDVLNKLRENKTGAHLYLDTAAIRGGVLQWAAVNKYNSAFVSGVEHTGNGLRIITPGHYLVYSQMTITRKYPKTRGGKIFIHSISRYHPKQPNLGQVDLLMAKTSYPIYVPHTSSFLCGVLKLRQDDRLEVKVSDEDSVFEKHMYSYFGVLKL